MHTLFCMLTLQNTYKVSQLSQMLLWTKVEWVIVVNPMVCTDLLGKGSHRQASMDRVIASGSLGSVMVGMVSPERQEV